MENIVKIIASLFRITPHFKGKYRIAKTLQKVLMGKKQWKNPEFFIQLKNSSKLLIDVRSSTHHVPFWTGLRDEKIIQLIISNLEKNDVFFDIGANIGYYAIPIAKTLAAKNVTVHAFEPVNDNFISLQKAIHQNNITNIITHKIALGDSIGSTEIIKTEGGKSGNAVLSHENMENTNVTRETIEITTLDDYASNNNINQCAIIKIDIEGAEIFFIKGAVNFITKHRPIIYGEFNSYFLRKFESSFLDIWEILEPLGYKVFQENKNNKGSFSKIDKVTTGLNDLLLIPEEKLNYKNWKIQE